MEYVIFRLINENFAIRLEQIKEILVYNQIILTPLFTEPHWIKGVINLRGEVIPIVDLRIRFDQEKPIYDDNTIAIVVKTEEGKLIGMIVDKIEQIIPIQKHQISQSYEFDIGIKRDYIQGFVKLNETQMSVILDIDTVLKISELV